MFAATTAAAGDPLFDAVAAGDKAAVEQALANGASVDSRASDQATPLMAAALANQTVIVEALLDKGASVMARNSGGFTPLHAAANAGSVPIAKLLLDRGAVLDDADNKAGVTPLMVAGREITLNWPSSSSRRRKCRPSRDSRILADNPRAVEGQQGHCSPLQTPRGHVPVGRNS